MLCAVSLSAQVEVGLVLPFENKTKDANLDWIGESFAETLTSELSSGRRLTIDRRERATAFDSLGVPSSHLLSNATVYKVAEALEADVVVLGSYDYSGDVFTARAQVLQMDGPRLSKPIVESGPLNSLLQIQYALAWQIHHFLRPDYAFTREEYLAKADNLRLDAFENYIRGLMAKEKAQQIAYFRAAQRLSPQYTKAAFELGMIYFDDRDYQTSAPWLAKLRRGDPEYLEANYFLGLAYLYLQQYERSATAFRVVELELPINEVLNNMGIALLRLDRPGAIQYLERAVAGDPADADYQFNLGYAYWRRGNYPQASDHLEKALGAVENPVWRSLYLDSEQKAAQSGALDLAAKPATAPGPSQVAAFQDLERPKDSYDGASLRQLRRLAKLTEEQEHAGLPLAEHVNIHFQDAEQFLQNGNERQAIEEFQLVIAYNPQEARAYRELAAIHLRAGRTEQAARMAQLALQGERVPEGFLLLARIYAAQGKIQEAQSQLDAVLQADPSHAAALALRDELNARSISRQ
jgi:tetratricopeptide (TPR) repeat protein/TolB-like protein